MNILTWQHLNKTQWYTKKEMKIKAFSAILYFELWNVERSDRKIKLSNCPKISYGKYGQISGYWCSVHHWLHHHLHRRPGNRWVLTVTRENYLNDPRKLRDKLSEILVILIIVGGDGGGVTQVWNLPFKMFPSAHAISATLPS